jgi:O-antigen chain-terminating methyltransferase
MESSARNREDSIRAAARETHQDYLRELKRSTDEIQARFWSDFEKIEARHQQLIETELRVIRRRAAQQPPPPSTQPAAGQHPAANGVPTIPLAAIPAFDYARFEERFRGKEQYVESTQEIYLEHFAGHGPVLDLGCGRGEFLALLSANGIECSGVDADSDAIAACRERGLEVAQGDLFEHLERQPKASLGGVFCAHVVEHLPTSRLPGLIALIAEKLAPGGVLAIETPNPNCLAIFAGDFFLDPTHVRPVPSRQLHFYFEECGFGQIEIREMHPAAAIHPELAALEASAELRAFRDKFFGALDYAIIGRKL